MRRPLSIVLPVYNAQATLAQQVNRLLEELPDESAHVEVLVVDDGSTDSTEEVANELAREYPQIRVLRRPSHVGAEAACDHGRGWARHDTVVGDPEHNVLPLGRLRRLWGQARDEGPHFAARAAKPRPR